MSDLAMAVIIGVALFAICTFTLLAVAALVMVL